jgi:hypothetical protein
MLLSLPAGAVEVRDDDFRMQLDAEGLCVAYPANSSCPGVDAAVVEREVAKLAPVEKRGGKLLSMAVIHDQEWSAFVMVQRSSLAEEEPFSREENERTVRAFAKGAGERAGLTAQPRGDVPERCYERVSLAGTLGIRSTVVFAPRTPQRAVLYSLFSPTTAHDVVVVTDGAHEMKARALIERWLGAAQLTPIPEAARARFDEESYYELGRKSGELFVLGCLSIGGLAAWLISRKHARR